MANVILIGCMGCGKSSVAVKLSYRLKQSMTDTDRWIEKKQGKTITEIFEQDGEEAFRQMETDALKYLKETAKNQVISVGGGLPVREENRALMKENGKDGGNAVRESPRGRSETASAVRKSAGADPEPAGGTQGSL